MVRGRSRQAVLRAAAASVILAAAAPVEAQEPGISVTVRLADPEVARVEVRFAPGHPFREARGLRRLVTDGDRGFRAVSTETADGWEDAVLVGPDGWVRIGVPLPAAPAPPDADLTFGALIHPPPGHRVVDPFPSRVENQPDGSLRMTLPAPPSLLRFRVVPEDATGPSAADLADLAVGLLLGALAVFGWSRLRRPSPETPS